MAEYIINSATGNFNIIFIFKFYKLFYFDDFCSFRMFLLLLLVMALCWLFFLSSFSKLEGLVNSHIIVNAFLGPLVLYICVFNQKHVSYLIRKTCCYTNCLCSCCRPEPECEWGDEMTAMNTECNY